MTHAADGEFDLSVFDEVAATIQVVAKKKRANWQIEKSNIIKRPLPAWNFFLSEHQKKTRLSITELCGKCSVEWKGLSAEERAKYTKMEKLDKIRYKQELASLTAYDQKRLKKCNLLRRQARRAKKSTSLSSPRPYIIFSRQNRAEIVRQNPDMTFGEISKEMGKKWRSLSDSDRAAFKTPKQAK